MYPDAPQLSMAKLRLFSAREIAIASHPIASTMGLLPFQDEVTAASQHIAGLQLQSMSNSSHGLTL